MKPTDNKQIQQSEINLEEMTQMMETAKDDLAYHQRTVQYTKQMIFALEEGIKHFLKEKEMNDELNNTEATKKGNR